MNPPRPSSPREEEAIEATAAAWLAQQDDGFTVADAEAYRQWRESDPRHARAIARLETTWVALSRLRTFRPEARRHPDRDLLTLRRARPRAPLSVVVIATGIAAAMMVAAVWWRLPAPPAPTPHTQSDFYATSAGGFQRVVLADGSVIELNASSRVRVRFTPEARRLELLQGEAHFTVTKNPERPFWVQAGSVAVRAVGTAFDVRLEPKEVDVLVTEGRVRVDRTDGRIAEEISTLDAGHRVIVSTADRTAPVIQPIGSSAIRELLAWQGPKLVFLGMPLAQVAAEFNRRNQTQLVIGDRELATIPIGGSFHAENIEAFVRLVTSDQRITAERPDPDHIVLRKAR